MSIFKLIIPFCEYKKGCMFDSFDGLVNGIYCEKTNQNINFDNKEYFVMISNSYEDMIKAGYDVPKCDDKKK